MLFVIVVITNNYASIFIQQFNFTSCRPCVKLPVSFVFLHIQHGHVVYLCFLQNVQETSHEADVCSRQRELYIKGSQLKNDRIEGSKMS